MTNKTDYNWQKPWWLIATWFGSGLAPKASGTAGSLAALPFAFIIQYYLGNTALFFAAITMFFVGWWASNQYLKHTGRNDDPKEIVVDEVVGIWLLLSIFSITWQGYLLAFIGFRFFDILKPYPISIADRKIKGGFGVMFDDVLAAIYPIILLYIIIWVSCFSGYCL
jgi:phosphatidylglycerophosphatase A